MEKLYTLHKTWPEAIMKKYHSFFFLWGIIMLVSEIWKQYTLTFVLGQGHYNLWYLPFQLCSIPMYVCLLIPWVKNPRLLGILAAFLTDYGLLGGIFAFFDTSGMHYGYAPLTVHSYLWHIVLIFIGLTAACIFPSSSKWSCFLGSTALFLVCCLIALILDLTLDSYGTINMFYINPDYPMAQKVFSSIALAIGNTPGILAYIGSIISGAALFHIIWRQAASRLIGPES